MSYPNTAKVRRIIIILPTLAALGLLLTCEIMDERKLPNAFPRFSSGLASVFGQNEV